MEPTENGNQKSRRKRKRSPPAQQHDATTTTTTTLLHQVTHPNFEQLALLYPDFCEAWQEHRRQKLTSPTSSFSALMTPELNIALTRSLLHLHFGLSLPNMPTSRLCPPVPNRFFYIQWIQSQLLPLLDNEQYFIPVEHVASVATVTSQIDRGRRRYGCDIGTGASCIYPLLFHASLQQLQQQPQGSSCNYCTAKDPSTDHWTIVATDIDAVSIEAANDNVHANQLDKVIKVLQVTPSRAQSQQQESGRGHDNHSNENESCGPICRAFHAIDKTNLLDACATGTNSPPGYFDFVMTNPPFYDDSHPTERTNPRAGDGRDRTPMTSEEGSYPGGEVGFCMDMIRDSLQYADRLGWCTCMLGKKSSFSKLKGLLLHLVGPAHVVATEFGPGHLTRWFLAWTLRRPTLRSPLALVVGHRRIYVTITNSTSSAESVLEVVDRTRAYISSINEWTLSFGVTDNDAENGRCIRAYILEERVSNVSLKVDEKESNALPDRISDGLSKTRNALEFLPREGHFCIDVNFSCKENQSSDDSTIEVVLDCYRHSSFGEMVVKRILSQFEGEVCRSNRRWRRRLKDDITPLAK